MTDQDTNSWARSGKNLETKGISLDNATDRIEWKKMSVAAISSQAYGRHGIIYFLFSNRNLNSTPF